MFSAYGDPTLYLQHFRILENRSFSAERKADHTSWHETNGGKALSALITQ